MSKIWLVWISAQAPSRQSSCNRKAATCTWRSLGYENLQPDTIVDGQIMELNNVSNVITSIFNEHKIKTTQVAAGVSGHSVIVKNIVVPQMSEEELQESFSWHAEEHIPFDIADVNLDYQITGNADDALVRPDGRLQERQDRERQAGDSTGRQAPGNHRCRRVRSAELLRSELSAGARRGCGAAEHRRLDDEHQHPERHSFQFLRATLQSVAANTRVCCKKSWVSASNRPKPSSVACRCPKALRPGPSSRSSKPSRTFWRSRFRRRWTSIARLPKKVSQSIQKILLCRRWFQASRACLSYLAKRFEIPVEFFDPFRQIEVDARKFDPDYMREVVPEMAVAVGLALRGVDAQ